LRAIQALKAGPAHFHGGKCRLQNNSVFNCHEKTLEYDRIVFAKNRFPLFRAML
jgi:hypothetical protein